MPVLSAASAVTQTAQEAQRGKRYELTEPFSPTVLPIGGGVPVRAQGIAVFRSLWPNSVTRYGHPPSKWSSMTKYERSLYNHLEY